MQNNNGFVDPLDEIMQKHKDSAEGKPIPTLTTESDDGLEDVVEAPVYTSTKAVAQSEEVNEKPSFEEDIYGDHDAERELDAYESEMAKQRAELLEHEKMKKAEEDAKRTGMPPRSLDKDFQNAAISFQADKIEEVNLMVQQVLAEKNIFDGYFPAEKRMHILGDLMTEYHHFEGSTPSEKFKQIVFSNWVSATMVNQQSQQQEESEDNTEDEKVFDPERSGPVVNINNHSDTPVTVNIDESLIPEINETRKVEINIHNIEDKEGELKTVIEDADVDSILSEHKTEINNVPITLPHSGYRAVIRPMNWFDYLKIAAPRSNNFSDAMTEKWSIIYDHIISTSIGAFESFDDFLAKTKFEDLDIFEWALFVATSQDVEVISYECNHRIGDKKVLNENGDPILDENGVELVKPILCKHEVRHEYNPRTTIKLDETKLPSYYNDVHEAAVGEEALKLFTKISSTKQRLTLPDSGYILEITRASAKDYITKKLPIITDICKQYKIPLESFEEHMSQNPVGSLYLLCAIGLDAIIIRRGDNDYRFSKWKDMSKIIDKLSNDDIQVIMQVFEKRMAKVASFEFHDLMCPECKNVIKVLPIGNIFELLGFNLTRRLQNTEVNLIDIV